MPYIKQENRDILDPEIENLFVRLINMQCTDEENNMEENVNYIFTKLLKMCYGESYEEINNALGVISAVQLEFYRRVAVPYENQAQFEHGDVENLT